MNSFWKGHPRNNPVKLFQNTTNSFRGEEFLRISLKSTHCKKSPPMPPWQPCFSTDQNFVNKFWKGSQKEQSCEIIPNSDHLFQKRRFLKNFLKSTECKKLPPIAAMFFNRSNFCEQFLKRVTQGTILWNYFKIGPAVSEEKIFKEFLKKFHLVAMATRVFDGIKFCTQFLKRTTQGTFLPCLVQIGPAIWEELMFKEIVDDRHWVILKAPLEHIVLRWAKNAGYQHFLLSQQCFQKCSSLV